MKKLIVILFSTIIILTTITYAKANEEITDGVDIMIIIDKSLSMNWYDPNLETLEATNHLLSLSLGTGNRIGFVVYNDTIIAEQPLRSIETVADINAIMSQLRGLEISRATDIGLALQTARRLLDSSNYRPGQTAIIFLSDGEHELGVHNPNRSQANVMSDVENVLNTISYPIFTIQYSIHGYRDRSPKNEWGNLTGGANFNITTPTGMIDAINTIYQQIIDQAAEVMALAWLEYEANLIHEHQLVIPIPYTEDERAEIVEVTIIGAGVLQEVILPDTPHITSREVGENHIITITEPLEESYTIYYHARSETPLAISTDVQMIPIARPIPWNVIGIVVSIIIALTALGLLTKQIMKKQQIKKQYPKLNGTLECYFMEIPTGTKDIPIQTWSASFLAGNQKISLEKLLKNVSLVAKMPEATNIFTKINLDNTISIINKAEIVCYKNGKEVTDKQVTLRTGEGLYMVFQKNTIEIELRVRQGSSRN